MYQPRKVPVWKDLNFIKTQRKVTAPLSAVNQISADVEALARWGVLDYSLLLAVNGDEFYMGLIDILTPFCAKKKLESVFVGAVRGKVSFRFILQLFDTFVIGHLMCSTTTIQ